MTGQNRKKRKLSSGSNEEKIDAFLNPEAAFNEKSGKKSKFEREDSCISDEIKKSSEERCKICRQFEENVTCYNGHPNDSCEEYIALTHEKLMLEFDEDEQDRPTHKITDFSVYCKNGHLCYFDDGLIETNVLLYLSGYLKPIFDEDPSPENGIPSHDLGPILEWWITGFDGGEKTLIGFTTDYGDYYLMEPSLEYKPFWNSAIDKIYLTKKIIEFLLDENWRNPKYEDLLAFLESLDDNSSFDEEDLLKHAQFICNQIVSFDSSDRRPEDEKPLISLPCMRSLVKMAGVVFGKGVKMRKRDNKIIKEKTPSWSKATTTNLVREVFETCFDGQIANQNEKSGSRKKRCGLCEACLAPECGQCDYCKDMKKFHGPGKLKKACRKKECPNMLINQAEINEDSEDSCDEMTEVDSRPSPSCDTKIFRNVVFPNEPILIHRGRSFYNNALVDNIRVNVGEFVMLNSKNPNEPPQIGKVCLIYVETEAEKSEKCHVHLFRRATNTILGTMADPRELFVVDDCEEIPLGCILKQAKVEHRKKSADFAKNGGVETLAPILEDNGQTFFYTSRYERENSRFVDYNEEEEIKDKFNACTSCRRRVVKKKAKIPVFENEELKWNEEIYKVGTCVFLKPKVYKFQHVWWKNSNKHEIIKREFDDDLYTEFYRKVAEVHVGSNSDTSDTLVVSRIEEIKSENDEIELVVRIFYRPHHIPKNTADSIYEKDLNYVYWTEITISVQLEDVVGKCYVFYAENVAKNWISDGPFRFYFDKSYDPKTEDFIELPKIATKLGFQGKGGKGKKGKSVDSWEIPPDYPKVKTPLRSLDVFAGCGGLSNGLHRSGVCESKWAIENEPSAAEAFRLNNPKCKVFKEDCNTLLHLVMNLKVDAAKLGLPEKGEVEMLVGGPPCQGFSGMNRFKAGEYSLFKNSLVVTYLSYLDYYRPKYFIFENVRNFASFKKSAVLKLTLRCLLAIGYQVTFGVLQAGHYGVPQTRRRLIIMASAPGYKLPKYPEPLHVFSKRGCQLSIQVDESRYTNGNKWRESAPFRAITVRDALSDLPPIENGSAKLKLVHDTVPITHFQRLIRGSCDGKLTDHVCKEMAPIVAARIGYIPKYPGADWRDLPNAVVRLSDGTYTNELKYSYKGKKQKDGERPQGVCRCVLGKSCDPADKQLNTLIPWCLPHTGDRHNHWSGLYGRLEWDGYFGTVVTNPEPMGAQGRVLHPEQTRVVSVRECARSQGFQDDYKFVGGILDKYRQIGNAVPPPLALAIGREVASAMLES